MVSQALAPHDPSSGALAEREEGVPTRRAEFRAFARKVIYDKTYQANLLKAAQDRTLSPAVERILLEAAHCSVKVDEQGGADELKRSADMRAAVEELVRSGKGLELDEAVMGATRRIRLRPNVPLEGSPDDDSAA